ncbi:unnamed protein product, partial [Ixodes persulcatus]
LHSRKQQRNLAPSSDKSPGGSRPHPSENLYSGDSTGSGGLWVTSDLWHSKMVLLLHKQVSSFLTLSQCKNMSCQEISHVLKEKLCNHSCPGGQKQLAVLNK